MFALIKKIFRFMVSQRLNDKYFGKNFVWVHPNCENIKPGDGVRCLGVIEINGMPHLNLTTGSPVPVKMIDNYLKESGFDIGCPGVNEKVPFHRDISLMTPEEIAEMDRKEAEKKKKEEMLASGIKQTEIIEEPIPVTPKAPVKKAVAQKVEDSKPVQPVTDIFSGFKKSMTNFSLDVSIELPNKALIDAMYINSDNKEEFVRNFSEYIISNINLDSVKDSVIKSLPEIDSEN